MIVSVFVPRLAVLLAVSVNVELPLDGLGENDAVTPLGKPETARLTLPVNPYSGLMSTYTVVELPSAMFALP